MKADWVLPTGQRLYFGCTPSSGATPHTTYSPASRGFEPHCTICCLYSGQNSPMSATQIHDLDARLYYAGYCQFRVWNSRFPKKSCFPSNRTSCYKYMLNGILRFMKFRIYLSLFGWKENILPLKLLNGSPAKSPYPSQNLTNRTHILLTL